MILTGAPGWARFLHGLSSLGDATRRPKRLRESTSRSRSASFRRLSSRLTHPFDHLLDGTMLQDQRSWALHFQQPVEAVTLRLSTVISRAVILDHILNFAGGGRRHAVCRCGACCNSAATTRLFWRPGNLETRIPGFLAARIHSPWRAYFAYVDALSYDLN